MNVIIVPSSEIFQFSAIHGETDKSDSNFVRPTNSWLIKSIEALLSAKFGSIVCGSSLKHRFRTCSYSGLYFFSTLVDSKVISFSISLPILSSNPFLTFSICSHAVNGKTEVIENINIDIKIDILKTLLKLFMILLNILYKKC